MNTTNKPLVVAFVVVVVLFVFFGYWGMTGGMVHDEMNGSGSMGVRSWIWTPALLTLVFGVVLGWFIFRKKE